MQKATTEMLLARSRAPDAESALAAWDGETAVHRADIADREMAQALVDDGQSDIAEDDLDLYFDAEDEEPETYDEAAAEFRAEFGREPDATDGDQGQLWSHVCAARSARS